MEKDWAWPWASLAVRGTRGLPGGTPTPNQEGKSGCWRKGALDRCRED